MSWHLFISPELKPIWEEFEQANIQKAITNLIDFTRDRNWECYRDMVLFYIQYLELEKTNQRGIITRNDYRKEFSQIVNSVIQTLEKLSTICEKID